MVEELRHNQIFVFGSNINGHHLGGAAKTAHEKFGAAWGIGVGLQGQSYAIPTMSGFGVMEFYCKQFLDFVRHYSEYEFLLTPVGTGIAGFSKEQVATLFSELPSNVKKVGW